VREIAAPAINAFRASAANFLAAVRGATEPLADGAEELQNLSAVEALERSLREGLAVKV
jgi:predicted dehydrogenase